MNTNAASAPSKASCFRVSRSHSPHLRPKQRLAVDVLQRLTDARAKAAVPPREARWTVFTAAAGTAASRAEILGLAAEQLGVDETGRVSGRQARPGTSVQRAHLPPRSS